MSRGHVLRYFICLGLAFLCFAAFHFLQKPDVIKPEKETYEKLLKHIERIREEGEKILAATEPSHDSLSKELADILGNWRYSEYRGDSLVFWSSHEWIPDSIRRSRSGPMLIRDDQGLDISISTRQGARFRCVNLPLHQINMGSFREKSELKELENWEIEITRREGSFKLPYSELYIEFYGSRVNPGYAWIYLAGLALVLVSFIFSFARGTWLLWLSVATLALLRWLSYRGILFNGADHFRIFDPVLFANSRGIPSLGDLAYHLLFALVAVFALKRSLAQIGGRTRYLITILAGGLLAYFGTDLILSVIRSLVLDSSLSFDITHLRNFNRFSILAFLLIGGMFWTYFELLTGIKGFQFPEVKPIRHLLYLLLCAIGFVVFQMVDAHRSLESLMLPLALTSIVLLLLYLMRQTDRLYRTLAFLALFSLTYSTVIYKNKNKRENEYLKIYAGKLINSNDAQAEQLFSEIENRLVAEFLVPADFNSFAQRKDQFEKRLRRLYFSGYLDKYELKVLSFDSLGNNINSSTLYSYEDLNNIYNFSAFPTRSNHFYQIKSTEITNGYLAKFENCDLNGHYGNIFILLEPRFIQSTYSYPELIKTKRDAKLFDIEDYSYGIYQRGDLVNQKGDFSYDLQLDSSELLAQNEVWNWRGYRHFIERQEEGVHVVLSMRNDLLVTGLSIFTFSFLFYSILLLILAVLRFIRDHLVYLIIRRRKGREDAEAYRSTNRKYWAAFGFDQIYLSTRIRLAMVALVVLGLSISLYFTAQFIRINDSSQARSDLMFKIREVAGMVQDEVDLEKKLRRPEARQLIVNEISDVYKVEVNVFDPTGKLLVSSEHDLYSNGLLAPVMDRPAYEAMRHKGRSQYIGEEQIRDLSFLSATVPLLNERREVIAYLNLPYFSRSGELEDKISTYMVTFVNVYFFLILLALVLAYLVSKRISKPLQILRDKLSHTGYGYQNEIIDWKRQDEIGQLVKQYNKMVVELEESARKLSESEREGAWKEMARQVAHEIKNPLTPMKLNIQHLQRAWTMRSDKLDETLQRVCRVLIEQIDSLTKLANEFSSFAKMPVDQFGRCDLSEILMNIIHLFEKSENVRFIYPEKLPEYPVLGDKDQLGRVFTNIIKNAIQAIPEDREGIIRISTNEEPGSVLIHIADNGSGIPEGQRKSIFVPNFSTKTSGMGLGLAITRKIVEASNGEIWFDTKPDEGSTFHVRFPLYDASDPVSNSGE
ncbi:MAG: GHKL domain-containing protein [Flavobacteriales bacterium]|nr:GHKL domain-containing protein [Flavobacteriales bacterium]